MVASRQIPDARETDRLAYIDGLRGVAIALVLAFHAWKYWRAPEASDAGGGRWDAASSLAGWGYQGVSLFLVISGFLLSLPVLRRRHDGAAVWFRPSEFFARRCLRILPPYYAALTLMVATSLLLDQRPESYLSVIGPAPDTGNVVSHLFLVHNLTRHAYLLNGSFWSLGLEWQWYFVFPFLLLLCLRSTVGALTATTGLVIVWHVALHDLWGIGALPARLFEFCCGMVAAQLVAGQRRIPCPGLVLGMLPPVFLVAAPYLPPAAAVPGQALDRLGLEQHPWGIMFASLLLLGGRSRAVNAVLRWRPLVRLGLVSYSVYLVHEPIVEAVETLTPIAVQRSPVVLILAIAASTTAGTLFHLLVERPCMSRRTWLHVGPVLTNAFRCTDVAARWLGVFGPALTVWQPPVLAAGADSATRVKVGSRPRRGRWR